MSRIKPVKVNYQPNMVLKPVKASNSVKTSKNTSFTGGLSPSEQTAVYNILTKKYKLFDMLSRTAGEVQNILFIGLGTALVAPIFIAYNPLSKQDEKTKKYSALRQPISAVIATATGLGVNMPVSAAFNKMAAEGRLQKFNMEAKPPVDFLKSRYNNIVKNFEKLGERDKKYFDMVNDGSLNSSKEFVKKYPNFQEFVSDVHVVTQKRAAEKLLDPRNYDNGLKNTTLKEFMVRNLKVKEHPIDSTQLNPDFMKRYLKDKSAVCFLNEMGIATDEAALRTFLGKNFYKEKFDAEICKNKNLAGELFNIIKKNAKEGDFAGLDEKKLEELFKDGLAKKGFNDRERKTIARLSELWVNEKTKGEEKIPMKTLFKVLGIEDDFHKHKILNTKMDEFLLWMNKNLTEGVHLDEQTNTVKKTAKQLEKEAIENGNKLLKFAGRIATNAVKTAESNFKSYSKIQGIVLSLAILPLSCGALNWSYPRIMEKCFPVLAGVKKDVKVDDKGGK